MKMKCNSRYYWKLQLEPITFLSKGRTIRKVMGGGGWWSISNVYDHFFQYFFLVSIIFFYNPLLEFYYFSGDGWGGGGGGKIFFQHIKIFHLPPWHTEPDTSLGPLKVILSTYTIVLFLVCNQNVRRKTSISYNYNKLLNHVSLATLV